MIKSIVGITYTGKSFLLAKEIESIISSYKSNLKKALVIDSNHSFEKFKNESTVLYVEPESLSDIEKIEISAEFNLIIIDFYKLTRWKDGRINAGAGDEIFKLINHNSFSKVLIDETFKIFSEDKLLRLIRTAYRYDLTFTVQDIEVIREIEMHLDEVVNLNIEKEDLPTEKNSVERLSEEFNELNRKHNDLRIKFAKLEGENRILKSRLFPMNALWNSLNQRFKARKA